VNQDPQARPPAAVVVLRIAGRPGPAFPLDAAGDNPLGRADSSCVVLGDRLASRAHATIRHDDARGAWVLRDLGSRNGTWLDGRRVGEASLADGSVIRIGTTELVFRLAADHAAPAAGDRPRSLVRSGPPAELEGAAMRRAAQAADARWQMLLYQAGLRLLAATSPEAVIGTTLELAAEFTAASSFGWFEPAADGSLQPRCVVPPGSDLPARVAATATETLGGIATWLDGGDEAEDVAAVPVFAGEGVAAVLAAAAPAHCLRESDFDLVVLLASLAGAAWGGTADGSGRIAEGTTDDFDDEAVVGGLPPPCDGTVALSADDLKGLRNDLDPAGLVGGLASLRLDDWQRRLVVEALRRSSGSVPEAAALLGVSRATLYRRLEAYGLTRDGSPPAPP